ncbi:MAG: MBL fold metallo-hydrolase [Anaerolineae bacterium]|nr:MBL fold metallo-hydrolase [Anaerolineae bacterium]
MTKQERVAENVYFFQSDVYAQVNAGVVVGPDMAIVIDTLPFPEETLEMKNFIEQELRVPVRYVINTHYHADHTWGNCHFPDAKVIAHKKCHELMEERGLPSFEKTKKENAVFRDLDFVLPHITFDEGEFGIQVGKRILRIIPLPGHTPDGIGVIVEEDRVMFSGDILMPISYLVDGDIDQMDASLRVISTLGLENIVQGHGDLILRGEVDKIVNKELQYLAELKKSVKQANRRKYPLDYLEEEDIDKYGINRVLLGGIAGQLHQQNLIALYKKTFNEAPLGSEVYFDELV